METHKSKKEYLLQLCAQHDADGDGQLTQSEMSAVAAAVTKTPLKKQELEEVGKAFTIVLAIH